MDLSKMIGKRLRNFRQQKKLSQEALGELAGLHGKYIGQLERGEKSATLETIGKLCRALDLPMEVLVANLITGSFGGDIAQECYYLILEQPEKEQKAILALIQKAIEYKKL